MSSSCIEEVSVPDDNWYRIANELLSRAGIAINGSAPADIRVKNPDFFKRVLQEGSLGLGESYMDGWWECDRLDMFFSKVLRAGLENQLPHHFKDTLRIAGARLFNLQSKKRAWIVGKEHYDLGNDLFSRMLDPFMQYSCAYWKDADNLESAQQAKLKMICEKLQLKPGMRVLDIGCGWGGLAHYMASNYDVSVVGVTISAEQQKMAQERCEGLDVTILLQDYRDLNDQFDRIVSVLQILSDTGDRAARADTGHEDVDIAVRVLPDLGSRRRTVDRRVRGVDELTGDKAVGDLRGKLVRLGDCPLHALRTVGEHELRAIGLHELAALHAHGLGHDDDDAVASSGGDGRKTDAGVAGGGLDDDGARLEHAAPLRVLDHGKRHAILHRAAGVKILQLCQYTRLEPLLFFHVRQLQQGRFADQLVCGRIDVTHV